MGLDSYEIAVFIINSVKIVVGRLRESQITEAVYYADMRHTLQSATYL